jgi:hypothetical protein
MRDVGRLISRNPQMRSAPEASSLLAAINEFCATGAARQLPS